MNTYPQIIIKLKTTIMRKAFFIMIGLSIVILSSCNKKDVKPSDCILTKADSLLIMEEVIKASDLFANANNNLDYNMMMNYWAYNHPDFIGVENLDFIQPDGLYERVKNFYTTGLDSTKLNWLKREIIPLSATSAHLYGEYEIYLKYESGKEANYYIYYSALLARVDGTWKALRIHESYNTAE